jgi:tetratricopeptide (TPR) repeat protein
MTYHPLQLAEAFIRTGELEEALEALGTHLKAHPEDDETRRLRISVLRRMDTVRHYHAALADLDALSTVTTADEVQRSILLQVLGEWQAANAAMERAHALAPDDDRITERYLLTLERSGSPEKARDVLRTLPPTWRWLQIAGDLAQRMGDSAAAVECYNGALAQLEEKLDTNASAFAANLKAVLILKRDSATGDA